MQQVSLDSPAGRSGPIYFSVSNRKLVLMNVFTLGFYQFHWFHQNWKVVEREG